MLPALLNIPFADPPHIKRVEGKIGSVNFGWELLEWRGEYTLTTQERQEQRFGDAWNRISVLAKPGYRRLAAALHYFHVACRLGRAGRIVGEFIAEKILNRLYR
jgi:hypothetical protein